MSQETHRVFSGKTIPLFKLAGIQIQLDFSWFLIFALVFISLAVGYFPHELPNQLQSWYWLAALAATLLFFGSILAHEMAHAIVALRAGMKIPAITLFIFGGISHMKTEAKDPLTEFRIAIVGPLTSFVLAAIFWMITQMGAPVSSSLGTLIFEYLAWINLVLGLFNLVPAFPLDGGRVFRAFWWWKTGSLKRGTQVAADLGKGFAITLMIVGGLQILTGGLVSGIWLIFIGMFLRGIAAAGVQELVMRQALEHIPARELLREQPISVDADLPLDRLVDEYFLRHGLRAFPVLRDQRVVGLVTLQHMSSVSESSRSQSRVNDVMQPLDPKIQIAPDTSLTDSLQKMTQAGLHHLLVMQNGRFLGMLTETDLLRYLEIKQTLVP